LFLVHVNVGLRRHHSPFLHDHGQARDAEDADADRVREHVQELLHHHGHVPPHHLLRLGRRHSVWVGQVWRGDQSAGEFQDRSKRNTSKSFDEATTFIFFFSLLNCILIFESTFLT
jgi:hypothetical protein